MARAVGHGGRDTPDYGISSTPQSKALVIDMSEIAVRLGSGNYYDRKGTQLFLELFDYGVKEWLETTGGAGSTIELLSKYTSFGPYAVALTCGAGAGKTASIQRTLPYPYVSTVGFEFHVKHTVTGDRFIAYLKLYDGSYEYDIGFKIDSANGDVYYLNSAGGWTSLGVEHYFTGATSQFHVIKGRVDIENAQWLEILVDTDDYPMTGIAIDKSAVVGNKRLFLYFDTTDGGEGTATNVLDNIIITVDEPR
jgi:hypothetical protein